MNSTLATTRSRILYTYVYRLWLLYNNKSGCSPVCLFDTYAHTYKTVLPMLELLLFYERTTGGPFQICFIKNKKFCIIKMYVKKKWTVGHRFSRTSYNLFVLFFNFVKILLRHIIEKLI